MYFLMISDAKKTGLPFWANGQWRMYLATEASISSSAKVLQDHECFLNNCLQASPTKNEK